MIRQFLLTSILLALTVGLQSCGLKGDLYLPPDAQGDASDHARETTAKEKEFSDEEKEELEDDPFGDEPENSTLIPLDGIDAPSTKP